MGLSVVMPALEMAQETGKLVAWLKQEGEHVRKGDLLLEVETDKAVVEIEAAGDGILGGVTAKPGDVIQVGHTIAWLLQPGETAPMASATPASGRTMSSTAASVTAMPAGPVPAAGGARLSPKARKLAQEHGVDIASLKGSGPGGEILADDILAAAQSPAEAGPHDRRTPGGLRLCRGGRLQPDRHGRSPDGGADDAKLDDRPAFLSDPARRRHGAQPRAREAARRRSSSLMASA